MISVLAFASATALGTARANEAPSATLELVPAFGPARSMPLALVATPECPLASTCLTADLVSAGLHVHATLGPGMRALPFVVTTDVLQDLELRRITIRIVLPAAEVQLLGRDYRLAKTKRALLDRFDPKWVALRQKGKMLGAVIVDDNVDTVSVTVERDKTVLELELFSVEARPFAHLPRCGKAWRDVHGHVTMKSRWLRAQDRLEASGEVVLGESAPIALSPWPDGRAAAFSITDHADQSTASTLHALLAGADDADLDHPTGGLLGHGIAITKALFLTGVAQHGWSHPQLEDPVVVSLADRMREAGSEVVPHSATPLTDVRDVSDKALTWFGARGAHVWIDHQPQTNCEGFGQAGWHTGTGIADLLDRHRFRDVWDLTEWTAKGLDERDPAHVDKRAATVWPVGRLEPGGPSSLWLFRSTWAFVPTRDFQKRYGDVALDALERSRGIHVAHTYLETLHPRGTFFGSRNLLVHARGTHIELDPKLEGLLASLQRRQQRGSLWVAPIGLIGDRMRAMTAATVRVTESGALQLHAPTGLDGLTVHVLGPATFEGAVKDQRGAFESSRAWLKPCEGAANGCDEQLSLRAASGSPLSLLR